MKKSSKKRMHGCEGCGATGSEYCHPDCEAKFQLKPGNLDQYVDTTTLYSGIRTGTKTRPRSNEVGTLNIYTSPSRATTFPENSTERKSRPVASGVLDYFPDALVAIAHVSWIGNEQHNPGQPLHWDRSKSTDEADAMLRHFLQRGTMDTDGVRHSAKMAWRALALLQKEIENDV